MMVLTIPPCQTPPRRAKRISQQRGPNVCPGAAVPCRQRHQQRDGPASSATRTALVPTPNSICFTPTAGGSMPGSHSHQAGRTGRHVSEPWHTGSSTTAGSARTDASRVVRGGRGVMCSRDPAMQRRRSCRCSVVLGGATAWAAKRPLTRQFAPGEAACEPTQPAQRPRDLPATC